MARRRQQELDASSIADIAFLLLAFIIIVTTLEKESGMPAFLPAKSKDAPVVDILDRNILEILVNKNDQIMIEGQWDKTDEDVKAAVLEFMENPNDSEEGPEMEVVTLDKCNEWIQFYKLALKEKSSTASPKDIGKWEKEVKEWGTKLKTVQLVGNYRTINKYATVAIQYDNSTSYGMYLGVRDNIMSGINKLRDDLAMKSFGVTYKHLLNVRLDIYKKDPEALEEHKAKIRAIRAVYPQKIIKLESTNAT